ncbi:AraC family transcriptional regulator [Aquisediminimonas profunda]|uniref:AraC family transcriptional regulator n=1 Tax=Aquisediminimonas profunda TaxID=1550733 RepID=UPI001C62BE47|nr:AraC family transcriptional regulator [Aquisediminimonas profunda]
MVDSRNESVALPMQHLRLALRMFGGAAETVERLLAGTGLHQKDLDEPDLTVPASALLTICDNVAEMVGEDWFLNLPILWSTDAHSELGLAMRVAPDFRAAIDVMSEFAHYRWPVMHFDRRDDRVNIVITLGLLVPVSPKNRHFAMCVAFLSFQSIVNAMFIQKANAIRYECEGDPPPYAARLSELFSGKISWGHGRSTITIPQELANQISPMASPALFTTLLKALRKIAADQGQKHPMISQKVAITLDNVTLGRLDAEEVAQRIGISRRTMERRLREEGTSFRELSNASLKQRLEQALRDPGITAESMAERLGFHDASSLLRASRRLFGASFSQLRREAKTRQSAN